MSKKAFKLRLTAGYLMVASWTLSGPILKTYFNLLSPTFFGIIGIWALMIGLLQKPIRLKYSIQQLLVTVVLLDILYIIGTGILNYIGNIKLLIIYDMVLDGPYLAILMATDGKLEALYLGRFKPAYQNKIGASIKNRMTVARIIGLIIGSILAYVMNVHGVIWVRLLVMSVGVIFELKALRVF